MLTKITSKQLNITTAISFLLFSLLFCACTEKSREKVSTNRTDWNKVKVLNIGVFHMGKTPDAHHKEFDENEQKNAAEIKEFCLQIAKFNPTIICIEREPSENVSLRKVFKQYKKDPTIETVYSNNEIQLLGFEIGRICKTNKIFGIDHQLDYQFDLSELARENGNDDYFQMNKYLQRQSEKFDAKATFTETILSYNTQEYFDFSINFNADMLSYANSRDLFEGADEATKFYQRNLRMYANINKIPSQTSDRILIISGAAHAAFFQEFMKRSPKYELQNLEAYLK